MKIGNIEIKNNAFLAPLAGFTDVGLRDLAARYGAGVTYTEMVSCKGIKYGSDKTKELLATTDRERIVAAQIFGNDPDIMAEAVRNEVFDKFDIIDINMGCPVPKIFNNGEGSSLLRNPQLAAKIVATVAGAIDKPITVKTRLGIGLDETTQIIELAIALQESGAAAITLHGRTREQYYGGKANWEAIARLREIVSLPVIANGDVNSLDSYIECLRITGADAVMIGRGAIGNSQLFKEIADYNNVAVEYADIDVKRDIFNQIDTLSQFYDDHYIYTSMRKQMCYYAKGMKGSRAIKDKACRAESVAELTDIINKYF